MEPTLETEVCLICFEITENHTFVPSDSAAKFFSSCNTHLYSTLTKHIAEDIQLNNKNQPAQCVCNNCFESASKLIKLSEQLTTIQKEISDLTVEFSMAVFHRRSQVYTLSQLQNNNQNVNIGSSSIIEFNEACLPPNLFSIKNIDRNTHYSKEKHNRATNSSGTLTDITNMKRESTDFQFGFSENRQPSVTDDDEEIFFKDNFDKPCKPSTNIQNKNLTPVSEVDIVHLANENDSKNCSYLNNEIQLPMSDLLKSVEVPEIKHERVHIDDAGVEASVENSYQRTCESPQKIQDQTRCKENKFSRPPVAPIYSKHKEIIKRFFSEGIFAENRQRNIHQRSHFQKIRKKAAKNSSLKQKSVCKSNQNIDETTTMTAKAPFQCSMCQKDFDQLSALTNHKSEKSFKCRDCLSEFTSKSLLKLYQTSPTGMKKSYKCSYCEKNCPSQSALQIHERIHTGEKPFNCSFCDKSFISKGKMKTHERIHTGDKLFDCSLCGEKFVLLINLEQHEKKHTEKKTLQCSFCNARYNYSAHLKCHERIHTGEKPYKCLYCTKSFNKSSSKSRHQKTHTKKRQ